MRTSAEYGSEDFQNSKKADKKIQDLFKKIQDFQMLASTMDSEAPSREAYKAVFGEDLLKLDPNTPEGMRLEREIREMFKNNE